MLPLVVRSQTRSKRFAKVSVDIDPPKPDAIHAFHAGFGFHSSKSFFFYLWRLTGSVGLVSRFGQFYKAVDPGLVQINVCTESLRVVDVKIQIISIGRQSVITRDNVNVEMYALCPSHLITQWALSD